MKKKVSVIISLFLCVFVLASCAGGSSSSSGKSYSESDFKAVYGAVGDIEVDPAVDKNDGGSVQMADSVKTAFTTAIMDPDIIEAGGWMPTASSDYKDIQSIPNCDFRTAVEEILGTSLDDIDKKSGSKILYKVEDPGYKITIVMVDVD